MWGGSEPFRIELRIFSDHQAFWDLDATIDDDILQSGIPTDIRIGQDDSIFDFGKRMDMHSCEE